MKTKWIIIIGLLLAAAAAAVIYFKLNSNRYLADKIKEMGGTSGDVSKFDKPFLKAWLKGLKEMKKDPFAIRFEYNGKYYRTIGGTGLV